MHFTYKATSKDGKTISGNAEAASKQALLELLHKQGIHPLLVEATKGSGKSGGLFGPKKKSQIK